jgi:hypothetical protein
MKTHSLIASLASVGLSAFLAGTAQASTIAGWDFSQYVGSSFLSIDGGSFTNTLDANYSDLDPNGAGFESAAYGTMLMDGSAGSTDVDPSSASAQFIPTTDSLASNLNAPALAGAFDSHTILLDPTEGQMFANFLSMTAQGGASVVFLADLTSDPQSGESWSVSFGGKTFSGSAQVGIEFSTDGSSFTSFGSVNLTTADTAFSVPLGVGSTDTAYVRLTFGAPGAGGLNQAIIDNLAINATLVPEPGTTGLFLAGLLGLVRFGRRRI